MNRICVYCGSKPGTRKEYLESAENLAHALLARGIGLVYGGASIGLMGKVADTMIENGGEAIGVIPDSLFDNEIAHSGLTELITVENMHQRKECMASLADGFVALPGGFGTMEEVFEAITWCQLKIHVKPVGLLNVCGYYDLLSEFIHYAVDQEFIRPRHRNLYTMHHDPDSLLDTMGRIFEKMSKSPREVPA
jgi:uncharacterized protein (TIGR00730 family)